MARKDLGGLAALGALGMLLAKKGDKGSSPAMERAAEKASSTKYEDDTYDPGIRSDRADVLDEMGMVNPRMKRNTETGDLYSPDEAITRPSARRSTKAAAPRKVQAAVDTKPMGGSGGGRGPAIGEVEAYRQRQYEQAEKRAASPEGRAERAAMEKSQALENVYPETNFIAPSLKAVAGMAKNLAGTAKPATTAAKQAWERARMADRMTPVRQTAAEAQAAREAAELAAREGKTLNPNAWLAGPRGMAENFKKGGKVKAEKPAAKGWGKARSARAAKYY